MILLQLLMSFAIAQSYPDHSKTPGVIDSFDEKVVCAEGYAASHRNVPEALKNKIFKKYFGKKKVKHGDYEIDHFVSLELGGSNSEKNLWPQPYEGEYTARMKDVVESDLHRRVCSGKMSLLMAQDIITSDWVAEYKRIKGIK